MCTGFGVPTSDQRLHSGNCRGGTRCTEASNRTCTCRMTPWIAASLSKHANSIHWTLPKVLHGQQSQLVIHAFLLWLCRRSRCITHVLWCKSQIDCPNDTKCLRSVARCCPLGNQNAAVERLGISPPVAAFQVLEGAASTTG